MASRPPLTPFGSALAGALGAVFSNAAVYPLDTVKTRLQALPAGALEPPIAGSQSSRDTAESKQRSSNALIKLHRAIIRRLRKWQMLSMLIRILRTEGISGAFKGFSANMINTFSQQFAYFFFHSLLRSTYIARQTRLTGTASLSTPAELSLGAAAGGLAQIFTIPAAVIATRQQLWVPGSSPSSKSGEPGFFETANEIIAEGGVTALWTGLRPGLVLTVNPAITYGVFERLKSWRLEGDRIGGKLGVGEAFWIGVLSKTLATVVTYPYIFVRLQARPTPAPIADQTTGHDEASYAAVASSEPGEPSAVVSAGEENEEKQTISQPAKPAHKHSQQDKGAVALLARVYKEKGLAGWYQGLGAQITKAVLCQGILFVSKDQFEGYAWLILDLIARLRAQVA